MEKKIFIVFKEWKCDGEPDSQILGATFSLDKAKEIMAKDLEDVVKDWKIDPTDEDWEIEHKEMSYNAINNWRDEWYYIAILEQEIV